MAFPPLENCEAHTKFLFLRIFVSTGRSNLSDSSGIKQHQMPRLITMHQQNGNVHITLNLEKRLLNLSLYILPVSFVAHNLESRNRKQTYPKTEIGSAQSLHCLTSGLPLRKRRTQQDFCRPLAFIKFQRTTNTKTGPILQR